MSRSSIHDGRRALHYRAYVTQPSSAANAYDRHVHARMIDFFTIDGMPWPRRLWDIGSILALEELWEAGAWAAQRVLSPAESGRR